MATPFRRQGCEPIVARLKKEKLPDQGLSRPARWCAKVAAISSQGSVRKLRVLDRLENQQRGNSGIISRCFETDGPPYHTGPEAQIQDNKDGKDPQNGWMYALYSASVDTTNRLVNVTVRFEMSKKLQRALTVRAPMNGTKYVEYEIGSDGLE